MASEKPKSFDAFGARLRCWLHHLRCWEPLGREAERWLSVSKRLCLLCSDRLQIIFLMWIPVAGKSYFEIKEPFAPFILGADATGRLRRLGSNLGARGPHCICQQLSWLHVGAGAIMLDPSWAMLDPCWGYVELCWDHVGSCSVKIGARLAHLGAMLGLWLAERVILKFCWGYVGSSGLYVGAKFAILSYVG